MKNRYFHSLDILRTIAAFAVVLAHYAGTGFLFEEDHFLTKAFYTGVNGVYIFFVVSGFIIPYSLYLKNYQIGGFWRYLFKRSLRIDPPYFVAIILYVALDWIIHVYSSAPYALDGRQFFSHFIYATPFMGEKFYDPVFWTLTVEFQFYILMAIFYALGSKKSLYILYMILFLLSPFLIGGYTVFNYGPLFMFGIITFLFRTKQIKSYYIPFGITFLASFYFHGLAISSLGLVTAILICHYNPSKNKFFFLTASFSYSLYLMHNLWRTFFFSNAVTNIIHLSQWTIPARFAYLIVIFGLSLLLSYLFYLMVEKPCFKYSKTISINPKHQDE